MCAMHAEIGKYKQKGEKTVSKWICGICGYVYDEQKEGVPFEDLPQTWTCPLCGADKASFQRQGDAPQAAAPVIKAAHAPAQGDTALCAGQMAALCSNLARGCQKQYREAEEALFQELATFFAGVAPDVPDADIQQLAQLLQADLQQGYPALVHAAQNASDRGTQRICVWGQKVTNILASLVRRYQSEGEAFLQDTQVWVCSVCGFIYVGDQVPQLCPVCKVPSWKFDQIEGRA